ncbi:MAG: DMT family transporter [Pseudomonadota bacterium]
MSLAQSPQNRPIAGIAFILVAMVAISVNDMLIKRLSGEYPLHELVFVRSAIGIVFSLVLVQFEGGLQILRTSTPFLHALRGILIVISNLTYFTALAVISLAEAMAVFFVAPLFITLLAIPVLGEKVGPWRLGAVTVGLVGVLIMLRPWESPELAPYNRLILLLPVVAAFTYAFNQVLTRRLGVSSKASAMAVYIQAMFILVSALFFAFAGDGRFAEGVDNASIQFLFRAWIWPEGTDTWLFVGLGLNSAIIGYALSAAYRLADAGTIAPFEYVGMPLAVFWGWAMFGVLPDWIVLTGVTLIIGAGAVVFIRERIKERELVIRKRVHRRY